MESPDSTGEASDWREAGRRTAERIRALTSQGVCYSCQDLAAADVFGEPCLLYEDRHFKAVLENYPRMRGHAIVVYKPHREDLTHLTPEESGMVFEFVVAVAQAMKQGLGAEKVYLNSMCDGDINHLHFQLLPRYPGDAIGSTRFVAERGPLLDGESTAVRIRHALDAVLEQRRATKCTDGHE